MRHQISSFSLVLAAQRVFAPSGGVAVWRRLEAFFRNAERPRRLAISAWLAVGPVSLARADECLRYELQIVIVPCGELGGTTYATGLTESGMMVGYFTCFGTAMEVAFTWDSGSLATLTPPPETPAAWALGANDSGVVVGGMDGNGNGIPTQPFVALDGVAVALPLAIGDIAGEATAVNGRGTSVGWTGASGFHAVRWDSGVVSVLQFPLGPNGVAEDIDELGRIAGWMGSDHSSFAHAFVYDAGRVTDVGTIPNGTGIASALNETGDVVGWGIAPNPNGPGSITRGFHWRGRTLTVIEPLPGYKRSGANDVNNNGLVVGECWNSATAKPHGFVWRDGTLFDLNDLVPETLGHEITVASAINDAGVIAGSAISQAEGVTRAVMLTPIPRAPGDLDCDDAVDGTDLAIVLGAWGACQEGATCNADIDASGTVDGGDLAILLGNWGATR